jgi:hypothetical protein
MNASNLERFDVLTRASPDDYMMVNATFADLKKRDHGADYVQNLDLVLSPICTYSIRVYPSDDFNSISVTPMPMIIAISVAGIFLFTTIVFFLFDRLVERRQSVILSKATQSTAILSSIYPKNIRDQLMADAEKDMGKGKNSGDAIAPNHRLKSFLSRGDGGSTEDPMGLQPLADLFPHT